MSFESICSTAEAGCWSCCVLRDGAIESVGRNATVKMVSGARTRSDSAKSTLLAITAESEDASGVYETHLEFYITKGTPRPRSLNFPCRQPSLRDKSIDNSLLENEFYPPDLRVARNVSASASSVECFALAEQWLRSCISKHEICQSPTCNTLPTRVIYVGTENTNLYLYEGKGEQQEYFALSHCWGEHRSITTTVATLRERKRGIVFEDLPRTFQHAVTVTRRLGVKYLWIDSLCILQDSAQDWDIESVDMVNTYGNATMVIAAEDSVNDQNGFLTRRSTGECKQLSIKCRDPRTMSELVYVRPRRRWFLDRIGHAPSSLSAKSPLAKRGWAFQERLIARRILHYTNSELVWECGSYAKCECRLEEHTYRPDDVWRSPLFRLNQKQVSPKEMPTKSACDLRIWTPKYNELPNIPPCYAGPSSFYCQWDRIAVEIARREFRIRSDILPAIAGIATEMKRCTGDENYFGLWYDDFAQGLLWYTMGCRTKGPRELSLAPSWSWTSAGGPIQYHMRNQLEILRSFTLVAVGAFATGLNASGAGFGAALLTGDIVSVKTCATRSYGKIIDVVAEDWEPALSMEPVEVLETSIHRWKRVPVLSMPPTLSGIRPAARVFPDTQTCRDAIIQGRRLFCLLIAKVHYGNNKYDYNRSNTGNQLEGLLLQKIPGCNAYRRRGYFLASRAWEHQELWEKGSKSVTLCLI